MAPTRPTVSASMDVDNAHVRLCTAMEGCERDERPSFVVCGSVFDVGKDYAPIKPIGKGAYGVVWYDTNRRFSESERGESNGHGGVRRRLLRLGAIEGRKEARLTL